MYDRIKRSNSSLKRKSKRLLEDSIERVIAVIKDEEPSDDVVSGSDGASEIREEANPNVGSHWVAKTSG